MLRRSRWAVLLIGLVAINGALFLLVPRYRFRSIVIHHSASAVDDYASIREQHLRRGWGDAAYHLILSNGSAAAPRGQLEATGRHRRSGRSVATKSTWCNLTGLHLCIVGNYDTAELPADLRPALAHAVRRLQRRYGIPDRGIRLHRDCSSTVCPGGHLTREVILAMLGEADSCPPELRAQHQEIIDSTDLAPGRMSRALGQVMAASSLAFVLVVLCWPRSKRRRRRKRKSDRSSAGRAQRRRSG